VKADTKKKAASKVQAKKGKAKEDEDF